MDPAQAYAIQNNEHVMTGLGAGGRQRLYDHRKRKWRRLGKALDLRQVVGSYNYKSRSASRYAATSRHAVEASGQYFGNFGT